MMPIRTGRVWNHLPHKIGHHLNYFKQLYNRMIAQILGFRNSVISSKTGRLFKLESNCRIVMSSIAQSFRNVPTQADAKYKFDKVTLVELSPLHVDLGKKFSVSSNKWKGNILNFIQTVGEICVKMNTELFDFSYSYDLEWRSRWHKLASKCSADLSLPSYQVWKNKVRKCPSKSQR